MAANKDVKIKLSADTKEAVRSVREFERQVNKLGDLADQGQRRQDGFLSSKQVQLYKRILREMEQAYTQHEKNLERIRAEYESRRKGKEFAKLRQLEQELEKRQRLLRNAEGGNKWGDVASPVVQEYHRTKLEEAQKALDAYKNSDELKKAMADVAQLEAELNVMKSALQQMQAERQRAQVHSDRIGQMHEMDPTMRRYIHGAVHAIGTTGAIIGFHKYLDYTMQGIDLLREQERAASVVALRTGAYTGVDEADVAHRRSIYNLGEQNNYDVLQTAELQRLILTGGTSGNLNALNRDTFAIQRFSRAYAIDPAQLASAGALLQRMGTLDEGQQQRFANMIAGAIAKNSMRGREEEMLRATISLAQSVSEGQAIFTQQQLKNTMGLQVALGQAVPELRGERGAQLLATMDSAIKNGGPQLDLLMGKGTEFVGLHGMTKLEQLKEQGLSNPENLQRILRNANRLFGGNEDMIKWALKEQLGLQMNEYDALKKSGLLDKIMKDPRSVTAIDLEKAGAKDLAKQWGTYSSSQTAQVDSLDAQAKNIQASHAQFANNIAIGARSLWQGLPDWMQHMLLPTFAIGGGLALNWKGGMLLKKATNAVTKFVNPNINGEGGLTQWLSKFKGGGGTPPIPPAGGGGFGRALGQVLEVGGKRLPIIGGALTVAVDQATTNDSLGRSIAKGIGSTIGGILGAAGGVALGFGTGGAGLVATGGMAVGGSMMGEELGDWVYSLFAGDNDKKQPKKVPTTDSTSNVNGVSVGNLNADRININNKDLASYFEKQFSHKDLAQASSGSSSGKEQVIRIIIEGDIKGMDKKNQDKIADSVKDYFSNLFSPYNPFRYNLAFDQTRQLG
jgi:hypothetical protein